MPEPLPVRRAPFGTLLRLAWRESRSARRRLLLYMSSISLGVAALVAVDSFAAGATRAVQARARAIFGADVQLHPEGNGPLPPAVGALLDSLDAHGTAVARTAEFETMARAAHGGAAARLVEVRVVSPRWPLYGAVTTAPGGAWGALHGGRRAIVDSSVLLTLGIRVGDSLALGHARFEVAGAIVAVPGDLGLQGPVRPRAFIPAPHADATGLLVAGSRVWRAASLRLAPGTDPEAFLAPLTARLDSANVHTHTVAEAEIDLGESVDRLRAFLSIIGLIALALGGVGVASGVHAYVRRKIDAVAQLRCLGATGAQVVVIYGAQAALLGLVGAAAGALLGVALQRALPGLLSDFMRFEAAPRVEPVPIVLGVTLGGWVALAFALRPLVALRAVSPLQVFRRDVEPPPAAAWRRDRARVLVDLALVATAVLVAAVRARSLAELAATSGAVALVLLLLWLGASGLARAARAAGRVGARARWPYVVRQGIANLHRPANQTRAVALTLGFGAFLVSTLFMVQAGVLTQFTTSADRAGGNIVFHDVQEDQLAGLDSLLRGAGGAPVRRIPVVTVRVAAVNGRSAASLAADSARKGNRWAFVNEHHVTYRDSLVSTERVVAGRWLGDAEGGRGAADEVSLDRHLAVALDVGVGDTVTWNVQGVPLVTRVTSVRDVRWAPFEPDFSVVFTPRALAPAPKMHVVLADVPDSAAAPRLQLRVAERFPNVGSLDLTFVRRTVREVTARVSGAIRFLSLFCIAMAVPVLLGAVAATSRDRVREGVLLKTLGASRRQIGGIVLTEYALLGVLGALTGMLLSFGGAWAVLRFAFDLPFTPVLLPALAIAGAALALTTAVGVLGGREVFRRTPMEALRDG